MTTPIDGTCDAKFSAVRTAFENNFTQNGDVGASFAVTVDGELVVDLWGGHADAEKTKPWQRDTIVNVYSTTKTMCALTAHLCADRGLIDFNAPVARYWPEFAQNGKDKITVAHLMSHSAGLPALDTPVPAEALYDWDGIIRRLEVLTPMWEPGTRSGYHAVTQGHLVGEVIRRVTGKSVGTYFRDELAGPLGADFHIGVPPEADARIGDLIPPATGLLEATPGSEVARKTFGSFTNMSPNLTKTTPWRRAEIPAAGGFGNARSVAQLQAILANDGVMGGKRFMSAASARKPLEAQITNEDLVLGIQVCFGLGYGLPGGMMPLPSANSMFWGGWGGSLVIIDYDRRMTMAYAMNKMVSTTTGDARVGGLVMGVYGALLS